jgi:hypothetical protein
MKRVFVLIVLSVALVGCGEPESETEKVSRALGGTEDDTATLERYLDSIHPMTDTDIAVMKAFTDGDTAKAEALVDKLHRIGRDSLAIAQDVGGEKLRTFLVAYSNAIQGVTDAYQAIVDAPADVTDAEIRPLGKRLRRSKERLAALDGKFLAVYKDVLPEDRYKQLQDHVKDVTEQAEKASGG